MEYKEKYNNLVEAIKVLQKANPSNEVIQNWVNDNVSELCESKDEKIRKSLIDGFKRYDDGTLFNGCLVKEILPWLERQGEQTTWKPNKEQIIALRWVLNNIPYNRYKEEISELLDQIKKL